MRMIADCPTLPLRKFDLFNDSLNYLQSLSADYDFVVYRLYKPPHTRKNQTNYATYTFIVV